MSDGKRYLAELGQDVLAHGYPIVPIKQGEKRPPWNGWESLEATPALIRKWVNNGQAESGIGILAATVPGADIDVLDVGVSAHMQRWILQHIGPAPVRFGQWPKRLLMFRTDAPFRKVQSRFYLDGNGRRAKVEILGDGQQFVSHAVHPDTRRPYKWVDDAGPHTMDRDELSELTEDDARRIVAEFERHVTEIGWKLAPKPGLGAMKPLPGRPAAPAVKDDDDWSAGIDLKGPVGLSEDEMRAKLLLIPAFETYGEWLGVGAALKHEYQDDDETGLELFLEYSSRCSNFDETECKAKWESFQRSDEEGAKTARYILALAKEVEQKAATEQRQEIEALLAAATTEDELRDAATQAKHMPFDLFTRNLLAGRLRQAFKRITKDTLSVRDSRDLMRYEDPERKNTPGWMEGWVYCTEDSTFYRRSDGTTMTRLAFNDAHSRLILGRKDVLEGRAYPEIMPTDAALNIYQVPVVRGRLYMPHEDDIFMLNGALYVNTYSDRSVPEVPEVLSRTEQRDVETAEAHFTHLFPIERDRCIFISWLAYMVKTNRRPNFAVLAQGVEGDGKTFILQMMAAILGPENVGIISGDLLEDKYSPWAEGHLLNGVEEVRFQGHNRFDILNRIKPYITNSVVNVRRMRMDSYKVPNTAGYLALTNYRDALPVNERDSRWFIIHSQWQRRQDIERFVRENPRYYPNLYRTIERSAGALRKWLLEYELHPEFNPAGRAPASAGKQYAVEMAKSDETSAIEELLAESKEAYLCEDLLDATALADALAEMEGTIVPQTQAMHRALSEMGFTLLGKLRVDGRYRRYWSQNPRMFKDRQGVTINQRIRKYLIFRGL